MPAQTGFKFTRMELEDLDRLAEIDRSEHITLAYELEDGELKQVEVDWQVPNWFTEGDGDHSLAEKLAFCRSHLDRGGVMLGGFQRRSSGWIVDRAPAAKGRNGPISLPACQP